MMSLVLKRDPAWIECLPTHKSEFCATLLLLSGEGHQVAVHAPLLPATSPLMRSILTDILPPAYSPCVLSLPAVTGDVLQLVGDILTTGRAVSADVNNLEDIKQVLGMLGVQAAAPIGCDLEIIEVGPALLMKMEVDDLIEVLGVNESFTECEEWIKREISEEYEEAIPTECEHLVKVEVSEVQDANFSTKCNEVLKMKLESCLAYPANEQYEDPLKVKVVQKCDECYDEAELETHKTMTHLRRFTFKGCQNCTCICKTKAQMDFHCDHNYYKKKCDYIAVDKEDSFNHKKVHIPIGKLYECGDCHWLGDNHDGLRHHQYSNDHRTKYDYEAIALAKAEAVGPTKVAFYHRHLAKEIRRATPKKCDLCAYSTPYPLVLKVHKQGKHEGIKFPCLQCDYEATTEINLRAHTKYKHTLGPNSLKCNSCSYSTTFPGTLKIHKKSKHPSP